MKTLLTTLLLAALIAAFSFTQDTKKDLATVNMVDGYYVFIQCKPVAAYDELGQVKKTGVAWSGSPKEMFNTLLRRAKKDYPKCDALIFEDVQMEHATCIRFK